MAAAIPMAAAGPACLVTVEGEAAEVLAVEGTDSLAGCRGLSFFVRTAFWIEDFASDLTR
jgi:hypothetical protein